jgi:hypothetical protein
VPSVARCAARVRAVPHALLRGNKVIGEYSSLAAALAYLATVLNFGDSIVYIDEPPGPVITG